MCNIAKQIFQRNLLQKFVFFRTCVDESLLCKGIPLCGNKNDLKSCKMKIPNMDDWTPIPNLFTCTPDMLIDHSKYIMPYVQTIFSNLISDKSHFYCLNRRNTNPFLITNRTNGAGTDSKTWTQWINTLCDNPNDRRCLGLRPDICKTAVSKYILLKTI